MARKVKLDLTVPQAHALATAIGAVMAGETDSWTAAQVRALANAREKVTDALDTADPNWTE